MEYISIRELKPLLVQTGWRGLLPSINGIHLDKRIETYTTRTTRRGKWRVSMEYISIRELKLIDEKTEQEATDLYQWNTSQ